LRKNVSKQAENFRLSAIPWLKEKGPGDCAPGPIFSDGFGD